MKIPYEMIQAALKVRMQTIASSGGKARAKKLTRAQRQEIGRKGAAARWGKRNDKKI